MSPRLTLEWHPTPHGELYCPGVGIVVAQYLAWYVYPLDGAHVRGPYGSMLEAQLSAEQLGTGIAGDVAGAEGDTDVARRQATSAARLL
jgi:hypothetical protein